MALADIFNSILQVSKELRRVPFIKKKKSVLLWAFFLQTDFAFVVVVVVVNVHLFLKE